MITDVIAILGSLGTSWGPLVECYGQRVHYAIMALVPIS